MTLPNLDTEVRDRARADCLHVWRKTDDVARKRALRTMRRVIARYEPVRYAVLIRAAERHVSTRTADALVARLSAAGWVHWRCEDSTATCRGVDGQPEKRFRLYTLGDWPRAGRIIRHG
jgi:hypothetical protein